MPRRSALAAIFLLGGEVACATLPRAPRGEIDLGFRAPVTAPKATEVRAVFRVEEGSIESAWLNVATSRNDDDCVCGNWSGHALTLCAESLDEKGKAFGGEQVRWSGPTGDLTIELKPDGAAMRVDGQLYLGDDGAYHALPRSAPLVAQPARFAQVHVTLPLGLGAQWDEIRETPVLYAVAAVSVGMNSDPPVSPGFRPLTGE